MIMRIVYFASAESAGLTRASMPFFRAAIGSFERFPGMCETVAPSPEAATDDDLQNVAEPWASLSHVAIQFAEHDRIVAFSKFAAGRPS